MRALIVDDERLARRRVRRLLERTGRVEVVGECRNGEEAVEAIRSSPSDIVFLDVQMADRDGFGVIEQVGPALMPPVVFVTAYEEYAVRAFESQALDYLLKPIRLERLEDTLNRLDRIHAVENWDRRLERLLEERRFRTRSPSRSPRLVVRDRGRYSFVSLAEVDFIRSEGNYVRLHTGTRSCLLRETMDRLEESLDPDRFLRIHRCTIVKLGSVVELVPSLPGGLIVGLRDGTQLKVSRGYGPRVRHLLDGSR